MEAAIRLYLDENLSPKIAERLKLRGIDAVSVREFGGLGESDKSHLEKATRLSRILVTSDVDFLRFAAEGFNMPELCLGSRLIIQWAIGSTNWS